MGITGLCGIQSAIHMVAVTVAALWESKMLHYTEALLRKSNLETCSVASYKGKQTSLPVYGTLHFESQRYVAKIK